MKNSILCSRCGAENPFWSSVCAGCKTYLRDKIVNINFWSLLWKLIESPVEAFRIIIFSERKNFILLLLFLVPLKLHIISSLVFQHAAGGTKAAVDFIPAYLISAAILLFILLFYSYAVKIILKKSIHTRFKDNFAILIYSLFPLAAGLILYIIALISFGGNLYLNDPSPFQLKPGVAYLLSGFEALFYIYSVYLTAAAVYTVSRNIFFGISCALAFHVSLFYLLYLAHSKFFLAK
jgi:hypothetical protein